MFLRKRLTVITDKGNLRVSYYGTFRALDRAIENDKVVVFYVQGKRSAVRGSIINAYEEVKLA